MRLINFSLLTPANVIAIGAIVFFWGAMTFFIRDMVTGGSNPGVVENPAASE